jgi:hypothetical protein
MGLIFFLWFQRVFFVDIPASGTLGTVAYGTRNSSLLQLHLAGWTLTLLSFWDRLST